MPSLMENVSILNSAVRTLLGLFVAGVVSVGAYMGYQSYYRAEITAAKLVDAEKQLAAKQEEINTLQEEVDRLDTAMRLLKVDHRVAQLEVLDQKPGDEEGKVVSQVRFQELNEGGEPIGDAREFKIQGDLIYIDSWIVKFDDKYVEEADLHRKTSLVMFRRLFGEYQSPSEAHVLDEVGGRPKVYGRNAKMSEFESKIWNDFWTVATDENRQAELGIRAAHGEAPSIKLEKGKIYRITLRASGGLTVVPAGEVELPLTKPAA